MYPHIVITETESNPEKPCAIGEGEITISQDEELDVRRNDNHYDPGVDLMQISNLKVSNTKLNPQKIRIEVRDQNDIYGGFNTEIDGGAEKRIDVKARLEKDLDPFTKRDESGSLFCFVKVRLIDRAEGETVDGTEVFVGKLVPGCPEANAKAGKIQDVYQRNALTGATSLRVDFQNTGNDLSEYKAFVYKDGEEVAKTGGIGLDGWKDVGSGDTATVKTGIGPRIYTTTCELEIELKTRRDGEGGGSKTVDTATYRFARSECSDVE
jgi:hypothetical protein